MNNIISSEVNGKRVVGLTLMNFGYWADQGKPAHAGGLCAILEHEPKNGNRCYIPNEAVMSDRDYAPEVAQWEPTVRLVQVVQSEFGHPCVVIELGGDSSEISFTFELCPLDNDDPSEGHDCNISIGNGDWCSAHEMLEYMPTAIKVFEHFGFHKTYNCVGEWSDAK